MPQWNAPLDPDCPAVRDFNASLDDPITRAYGVGGDLTESFTPKHRANCERCQEYGAANIEVV
jgi:hypothetical protein